jgi:hypothetical protein
MQTHAPCGGLRSLADAVKPQSAPLPRANPVARYGPSRIDPMALFPPSIDRLHGRENCFLTLALSQSSFWIGRCVGYPDPLPSTRGDLNFKPNATMFHLDEAR